MQIDHTVTWATNPRSHQGHYPLDSIGKGSIWACRFIPCSKVYEVLRSIGNLVAGDNKKTDAVLAAGQGLPGSVIGALIKCLESEHRTLKKEAAWAISNIAAGSLAHKQLIFSSGAISPLLHLLATAAFDIRKEVAFVLGNLCVVTVGRTGETKPILEHLTILVDRGCLPGFINLIKSPDIEAARLGLQFLELESTIQEFPKWYQTANSAISITRKSYIPPDSHSNGLSLLQFSF
eukprot:Gb_26271 [translate_table: standard]